MGTWRGDPDDAAGMIGDDLVIDAGNEALLPAWPSEGMAYQDTVVRCGVCATSVKLHGDAGWRHELGYRETGGCSTPWPEG